MFLTNINVVSRLLHLTTSDRIARIPSILHNNALDWLKLLEVIQGNALIISVLSYQS
jgi:hypothetical protein